MSIRPRTLRGRLAVLFGLVTIALAILVGGFVILRYQSELSRQINENLETRFDDLRTELAHAPKPFTGRDLPIIPRGELFAQVMTPSGTVLAASPKALLDRPVLGPRQLAQARNGRATIERAVPPSADRARLLVGTQRTGGASVVLLVGTSLDQLDGARDQLTMALAIGLPILALVVITAGWILVGAALRPVRAMVEEADAFSVQRRGQRLPVGGSAEIAELGRRLNDMLERIEEAFEHERAFLDDASHELRTPLAIARGELELAALRAADEPESAASIASALEEVGRLERLASNLLVLARTRGTVPATDESVDLGTICQRVVERTRKVGDGGSPELHCTGRAVISGDAAALERAVGNLVDNAARHAASHVDVTVRTVNGQARVEVRDDGPGLPRAVLEQPGVRFVKPASEDGAGLGLAIVDAIVATHGGRLELESPPAGGTIAVIRLPVAR